MQLSFFINEIKNLIKTKSIDSVVFDNSILSNKNIINHFEMLKNEKVSFKIHPKTTNYLIGSNSSEQRGNLEFIAKI